MFTNHSALKYLVYNKPVFGGKICLWLLLFQEFDLKIIVKSGLLNVGLDHFSQIEEGEEPTNIEDGLPDAQLFKFGMVDEHYEKII